MAVASNVVFMWVGTNTSIPSGWTRETDLDGKYPLGAAAGNDGGGTGGQASHTHTSDAHNHTQDSHTHSFSSGAGSGGVNTYAFGTGKPSNVPHVHGSATSNAATATNQNTTVVLDSTSNDPPYYEVIFIKSNGTNDIPDDTVGLFESATPPTNWNFCDGSGTTPDMRNRFSKGAGVGGDAGGTGGSLDAHNHSNSAHNHTQNGHTHSSKNSGSTFTAQLSAIGRVAGLVALKSHIHSVSLSSATATNQTSTVNLQNADGQPPYKKLLFIQNNTGDEDLPDQIIGMWGGAEANIPSDWARYGGMDDYFLKNCNDNTEIGNTGGADQHSHTADSHNHTQDSHNHGSSAGGASVTRAKVYFTPTTTVSSSSHTHSWTIGNTTAVNQATTIAINNNTSKNNYPSYYTVIFIQYTAPSSAPMQMLTGIGT